MDLEGYVDPLSTDETRNLTKDAVFHGEFGLERSRGLDHVVLAALEANEIDILGLCQKLGDALQGSDERKRKRGEIDLSSDHHHFLEAPCRSADVL